MATPPKVPSLSLDEIWVEGDRLLCRISFDEEPDYDGSWKVVAHVPKSGEEVSPEEIGGFVKERVAFYKAKRSQVAQTLPHGVTGNINRLAITEAANMNRRSGSRRI